MTSTTDTDEHPEVSEISALADGLLPPDRTADLRRHLQVCDLCADVRTSLDEIRSLLGTLPGPARMPDDVAGRIDAALAAEALLDSTSAPDRHDVSRETPAATSGGVSRETSRPSEETERAAAGAPADRPAGRPRATTGPGRRTPRPGGRRGRSRRWPQVLLGTACAAAVLGMGTWLIQSSDSGPGDDRTGVHADSTVAPRTESASLSAAGLESRVHQILTHQGGRHPEQPSREVTAKNSPDTLRADDVRVPSCVQAGTGRSEAPLAAQEETYDGTAAYLVVLPHPADASRVDAFVIDAACTTADPPSPGAILANRTYDRR
ncbi:hypothetical protein [Streptomyces sp. XD-27]|uniref:hypothetical protein n=1 Tax=Streptomyces sp. XD-27 TaxID=3062779 RepID=UPI0026F45A63|nr:hypothetical protein [Streptomyces sp. XD-27]WKX71506.1 hypothetical protein Q3Y56_17740 [Streptomyces sp. XD-27]